MKVIKRASQLTALLENLRARGKSVGFVPTMGALHKGHVSLVKASKRKNQITVVSIFVNPTQFGPKEDFKKYPRVFGLDRRLLSKSGVDFLFYPSVREIYPEGFGELLKMKDSKWPRFAKGLCGKFRPGHFQGVVTVVAKLLNIVGPCRLYLGAKDYQQAMVLKQLVKDLSLKVQTVMVPTVREKDGLAMSSRNRYLSAEERQRALVISKVLFRMKRQITDGRLPLRVIKRKAVDDLKRVVDRIQYLEIMSADKLSPARTRFGKVVILAACFVGKTRLIDNVIISVPRSRAKRAV